MKKVINIFIYIFGMAIFTGGTMFIIALCLLLDKTPKAITAYEQAQAKFRNYHYLTSQDFEFALLLATVLAGLWIITNVVLVFLKGFDNKHYNDVVDTLKSPFVQFFGIAVLCSVA
ncbi:MAG TPA: hypothetical protein VD905_04820, partial [Flavobacteriales bacterium]|nr:hypothetical protein [Flavobacteriales bacterium]